MDNELIGNVQTKRTSKVITYITGDRRPVGALIAEDAVRILYEHLLKIGKNDKIDLILYSRGGDVSVPWRIVSMFREFCGEFSVLIPYKAHSAATLIALGADSIQMGKKSELSPIDPSLQRLTIGEAAGLPQEIGVEDINSYIAFIKERANINDQMALAQMVSILANHISPLVLGSVNRQNSHIRLVARKLLTSRKEKLDEAKINSIIETLAEKCYSHGHAIGRNEAREIGLPVEFAESDLEEYLWKYYLQCEDFLKLSMPLDPFSELKQDEERHWDKLPIAVIQSEALEHIFYTEVDIRKRRQIPSNPQLTVNLALNLPPIIKPEDIPQDVQKILQQLVNQVAQEVPRIVQTEIAKQSPIVGIDIKSYGGGWARSGG